MPAVYNLKMGPAPEGSVYIGRPSAWGNPFIIGRDGTREQVVQKFAHYLQRKPELVKRIREELKGKDLVCYCKPLRCHGDVLLKVANEAIDRPD